MKLVFLFALFVTAFPAYAACDEIIDTMPPGATYRLTDHAGWRWYTFTSDTVGVVRKKDDVLEHFTAENSGLAGNNVTDIAEDRHFNIWFIHNTSGIIEGSCSRYDGVNWESYYPSFLILGAGVNADGDFQISCYIPYFETEMYYESIFDGSEWHAYLVGTSCQSVEFTRRFENGRWIVEGLDTDNTAGGYANVRPAADYFPLTVGSTWSYRRTVSDFTDTVIMQVAGTVERDGHTWAVMLDGRSFRQDEDGNVYLLGSSYNPYFDFRPCEGENCDPYYLAGPSLFYSVSRSSGVDNTPAGTYDVWEFTTFYDVTIGLFGYSLAKDVGLVEYGYFTDFGLFDEWALLSYNIVDKPVHVSDTDSPPAAIAITSAYPNPFNGAVTVEYVLSSAERATIDVYNLAGQRVRRLKPGPSMVGTVVWDGTTDDGSSVATGVYIVRLSAGSSIAHKSVTYIK